jgi:hypothetical protein
MVGHRSLVADPQPLDHVGKLLQFLGNLQNIVGEHRTDHLGRRPQQPCRLAVFLSARCKVLVMVGYGGLVFVGSWFYAASVRDKGCSEDGPTRWHRREAS